MFWTVIVSTFLTILSSFLFSAFDFRDGVFHGLSHFKNVSKNKHVFVWLIFVLFFAVLTFFVSFSSFKNSENVQTENLEQKKQVEELQKLNLEVLSKIKANTEIVKENFDFNTQQGYFSLFINPSSPIEDQQRVFLADKLWRQKIQSIREENKKNAPSPIKIEYFAKINDENKVVNGLVEATLVGFEVEFNPPSAQRPCNYIKFGESVDEKLVEFIGLTLMRSGVKIQFCGVFKEKYRLKYPGKKNTIQIGFDSDHVKNKIIEPNLFLSSISK